MKLKELRNEQGKLSGLLFSTDDIAELKASLRTDSQLFNDLNVLMEAEGKTILSERKMPNGLTVAEINERASETTERLYKDAFSKGIAMYYQDERTTVPGQFVRANPDGSEDLVNFDRIERKYSFVKNLVSTGKGRWAYLV